MLKLFIPIILCFSAMGLELKAGDILLQPLHCRLCNLIEAETNSIYSHIGIVIDINDEVQVAEAFIKVRSVSLDEFMSKTQKRLKVKVVRPKFSTPNIKDLFFKKFNNLSYDSDFLWGNINEKGEMIYCSELIYKLLTPYSYNVPEPAPMRYDVNPTLWDKFFKGNTPRGKLGISPGMFDDEMFFDEIGEI